MMANELNVAMKTSAGPLLERKGDLTAVLTSLEKKEVFFLDEIHRLQPALEEVLYPAMEDFRVDLIIGQGPGARIHPFQLGHFTLIGATTRAGLITAPLRSRFGIVHRDKSAGGPVGLGTLAAALSEEEDAIEEMCEPCLMQIGMIDRPPRGRVATQRAYEYFGRDLPKRQPRLF